MEPWLERWVEGRIGWHEPDGNRSLKKHWSASGRRVLVPLCGKSMDLVWLEAKGNEVVGVELSELAARAFFDDNELDYRETNDSRRFEALDRHITIVCVDYFEFHGEKFDAHYDRGALAALPPNIRARYAAHTNTLISPDVVQLLVVLEYDQAAADGPPFSVTKEEVLSYWPGLERVDAYDDIDNAPHKFRDAGLDELLEVVWRSR